MASYIIEITEAMLAETGAVALVTADGTIRGIVRGPGRVQTDEPLGVRAIAPPQETPPAAPPAFDRLPLPLLLRATAELAGLTEEQVVAKARELAAEAGRQATPAGAGG